MSFLSLVWMAFAWMLGGFIHCVTSIGCAMVAMPLISFVVDARESIIIACLAGGFVPLMLSVIYRRHLLLRETLWFGLGCLPGIPAGTALLAALPGRALFFGISVMLLFFVAWQMLSHRVRPTLPFHPAIAFVIGLACSFLAACTSLGGPVLAVYAAFRGWQKEAALATTSMDFNILNAGLVLCQWQAGLYTPEVIDAVLVSLPASMLGVFISIPVVRRIPQELFRKLLLLMVLGSGLILLGRAVL